MKAISEEDFYMKAQVRKGRLRGRWIVVPPRSHTAFRMAWPMFNTWQEAMNYVNGRRWWS